MKYYIMIELKTTLIIVIINLESLDQIIVMMTIFTIKNIIITVAIIIIIIIVLSHNTSTVNFQQ